MRKDEEEKESKSSFSNWFYFVINVGAMIASPVLMNVAMLVGIWPWLPSCSSREATSTGFRNQEEVPSQECFKSLFASFQKIQIPEAPDAMRSLCSALSLTTVALGNYLSTFLATVVTKVTTTGGRPGWIADNLTRDRLVPLAGTGYLALQLEQYSTCKLSRNLQDLTD
ncbi:LOW QUALITY PROTEIN: hypothetical protein HID58_086249 [Brassica napus]|uniref:Uncharacterized protein n=1 Tax=Brassica napus TaxID=3708 RepID=A0ABQ7XQ03_BRANA|nr:LOW QUALITY PROTEIN: hypothetical protein HID58_086249 [Brassica napus]